MNEQIRHLTSISKVLNKIDCCLGNFSSTAELEAILEAIQNLTLEIENNLTCSIAKACNADTCEVVTCKVCTDVEGTAVSTELYVGGAWIPDADYTGTLDVGCLSCSEPIPTYDYETIPVCFDDCSQGYTLIKINGADDSVTPLGVFNSDGTDASSKTIVPCQSAHTVEGEYCIS